MLETIDRASLDPLWLPLAFWTAVTLPAYLALRWRPPQSPLLRERIHQALLFALPLGILGAALFDLIPPIAPGGASLPSVADAAPSQTPATGSNSFSWTLHHTLGLTTLLAGTLACWQLARLVRDALALQRFRHHLPDADPPRRVQQVARRLFVEIGLRRRPCIVVTPANVPP